MITLALMAAATFSLRTNELVYGGQLVPPGGRPDHRQHVVEETLSGPMTWPDAQVLCLAFGQATPGIVSVRVAAHVSDDGTLTVNDMTCQYSRDKKHYRPGVHIGFINIKPIQLDGSGGFR